MTRRPINAAPAALAAALLATLALAGCKKDEPAPPPPVATPAPAPAPAPPQAPAAPVVSVTSVDLGNAIGADNRVTTATAVFGKTDTIYASVNTSGAATATNKLNAKWSYQDGQTVHTEDRAMQGADTIYEFHINNPKGWPVGKYKVDISLDGMPVKSAEFTVAK